MTFIDATIVKGTTKIFTVSIQQRKEDDTGFEPLDLTDYAVAFRIMGAATADAKVLVEKIITQGSDEAREGNIFNATGGEFSFTVTAEDTKKVGLGEHPIMIELLDATSLEPDFTLTEGGLNGEFNSIKIVQV